MRRPVITSMVASLLVAASVFANAGPPPLPKDHKVIQPPVRFEGIDKHPDQVFYLYYSALYYGHTLVEVKDAEPIKLDFKAKDRTPVPYLRLMAMERKEFEKRKKDDPSLKWLVEAKDDVLSSKLVPPETTLPRTVKDVPLTTYRVKLSDGKLSAEKVEDKKSGAAEPSGFLPPRMFGVASSLSIACLGIWFARRGTPAPTSR